MGASEFGTRAKGKTAREAFKAAQDQAFYDHGHAGYSGTIAEKNGFVIIAVPDGHDPIEFACRLVDEDDPHISGKWGPAGCVKVAEGVFYFFGWASS